jgi:uncharacterized protein
MNNKEFSWINPKLEVRESELGGKGIFSNSSIDKDELLAVFGGYIMRINEEESLEVADLSHQMSEDFVIGVINKNQIQKVDHFNHSCEPNAGVKGQLFLVAFRDTEANEEITFDYAMVLHHNPDAARYEMKCKCGAKNCRGIITEDDWKLPELQKKYAGYFQYYLEEKIKDPNRILYKLPHPWTKN